MSYKAVFNEQQRFFSTHRTRDTGFRKAQLRKLKRLILEHESLFYEAIYKDFRKSRFDTFTTELSVILKDIDYYLRHLDRLSRPKKVATNLVNLPGKSRIYPEPLGVVLVIGAWNYPYQLSLCPLIAAMAAGNCCIVKPSELPAATMKVMAQLINGHFDREYIYVAEGGVPETTGLLQCRFDKIFFTGSPKVGQIVYEAAARLLVPVVLELGGKSPAIVSRHADIDTAARRIVWGKYLNAGQTCVAPDYVVVEAAVRQELTDALKKHMAAFDYKADAPHYTAIINDANFDRLTGLLEGAAIAEGGAYDRERRYIAPAILEPVQWEDDIMQQEIFGPLLPVLTFNDFDGLLARMQEQEKPLAAYLFSNDTTEQEHFLTKFSFGGGCINDVIMHLTNDRLPFGGIGRSGIGSYHGPFGFDSFSHHKAVLKKGLWGEPSLKYPPYTQKKYKWIRRLLGL